MVVLIEIPLTQEKFALVDEDDYAKVSKFKWRILKAQNDRIYVQRHLGRGKGQYLHRFILNAPKGICVDHINRNGLDNRKENLRLCSHSENKRNQIKLQRKKGTSSQFKGVRFHNIIKKWEAYITTNKKTKWLGYFNNELAAAIAYNESALKYHGEFARLNNL